MNIDNFNQLLSAISKTYEETIKLREELSGYSSEQIIGTIEKRNKELGGESGWISREAIVQWVNGIRQQQSKDNRQVSIQEIEEIFPYVKISNTVLIATCLKKTPSNYIQLKTNNKFNGNPLYLLIHIIFNQVTVIKLRKQLIPLIQLYIPISGFSLTLQQLKDYLLLSHNTTRKHHPIDPTYVMMALNGNNNNERLQFQMYKKAKDQSTCKENYTLNEPAKQGSMDKIREIMNRLNSRVDNFCNQWLINRPQVNNTQLKVQNQNI